MSLVFGPLLLEHHKHNKATLSESNTGVGGLVWISKVAIKGPCDKKYVKYPLWNSFRYNVFTISILFETFQIAKKYIEGHISAHFYLTASFLVDSFMRIRCI